MSKNRCPHCARPGLFPNVYLASLEKEKRALERRYRRALEDSDRKGCGHVIRGFETRSEQSRAVITRSFEETMRLASGDHNVYATYHQLAEIEFRIPRGSKWDKLRALTDQTLFDDYMKEIRFAALTLDGHGLTNYGECSWVLRNDMIAHRASVFEENSIMFMERHDITVARAHLLPPGYRASWGERSKLCVAKLARRFQTDTSTESFDRLLIRQGTTAEEDEFIEVHVGGPMTVRTLERVIIMSKRYQRKSVRLLEYKLATFNVDLEVRPWTQ